MIGKPCGTTISACRMTWPPGHLHTANDPIFEGMEDPCNLQAGHISGCVVADSVMSAILVAVDENKLFLLNLSLYLCNRERELSPAYRKPCMERKPGLPCLTEIDQSLAFRSVDIDDSSLGCAVVMSCG